jgi:phosphate-selective porin
MTDIRHLLVACWILILTVGAAAGQPASPAQNTQNSAAQPDPTETKVDISRGGLTISSGVNSISIGARGQFRWVVDDREQFDADTVGPNRGRADDVLSQFDVTRFRVTLSGGVFRPWFRYLLQLDFSRTPGEGDSKIKDAMFEIRPTGRNYRVVAGQFKAPFGLQQQNSSGRLQFVDRAITDPKFSPGREMGAMVAGTVADRKVGYELGAFNASGESVRQNNQAVMWAGHLFFQPFGPYALSEGSSDAGDTPLLHLGTAVRGGKQIRGRSAAGVVQEPDNQMAYSLEFVFKAPRVYSTAEYYWMTDEQEIPVAGPDIDSHGYHVQVSFMPVLKTTEIGLQYARIAGDTRVEDAGVTELRGVFSYYWQAHGLKLQTDIGRLGYDARYAALSARARQGLPALGTRLVSGQELSDIQLRMQWTVAF